MGWRWAWMGVVGVCALSTGCKPRERHEQAAPAVAARAPAPVRPATSSAPLAASEPARPVAQRPVASPAARAPAPSTSTSTSTSPRTAPAPQAPGSTVTESTTQQAPEGRVMIGSEAIQASEDEAWYEGAAKAVQAAGRSGSVPLDQVVIATGTVDGRVTRVAKGTVHVRDSEGNVYQLRTDRRSRGLHGLEEGTPVRASFDLVGGSSIARDIEVRR